MDKCNKECKKVCKTKGKSFECSSQKENSCLCINTITGIMESSIIKQK